MTTVPKFPVPFHDGGYKRPVYYKNKHGDIVGRIGIFESISVANPIPQDFGPTTDPHEFMPISFPVNTLVLTEDIAADAGKWVAVNKWGQATGTVNADGDSLKALRGLNAQMHTYIAQQGYSASGFTFKADEKWKRGPHIFNFNASVTVPTESIVSARIRVVQQGGDGYEFVIAEGSVSNPDETDPKTLSLNITGFWVFTAIEEDVDYDVVAEFNGPTNAQLQINKDLGGGGTEGKGENAVGNCSNFTWCALIPTPWPKVWSFQ